MASFFLPARYRSWIVFGSLFVPVAAGEVVVEVLSARAHSADVQREIRLDVHPARINVIAQDTATVGAMSKSATSCHPSRRAKPSSSDLRKTLTRLGEKKTGSQPSAISAASATFFGPIAAR